MRHWRVPVVAALAAIVVGCLAWRGNPASDDIGRVVPDLKGVDLEGRTLRLSDYRGKVVLLDFWMHT